MDDYHSGYIPEKLACIECKGWFVGWQFGSERYAGYCFRCFKDKFPEDDRVKQQVPTENFVNGFIEVYFPDFIQQQELETAHHDSAHWRQIKHYVIVRGTMICIDTDEQAYRRHDPTDEVARYNEIVKFWSGKTVFIRIKFDAQGCMLTQQLERLRYVYLVRVEGDSEVEEGKVRRDGSRS
jgi:hypothetical protein